MIDLEGTGSDIDAGIANWKHFPASCISHHGEACCEIAREWMLGFDFSQLNGGNPLSGPRWLRKNFKWGPSKWPIHWCEAVREKTLDCGALAALSNELFLSRGVQSFPAQFILEFNDVSTRHWKETWGAAGSCAPWISEGLIYHEGCAIAVDDEVKLWDATATWWINSKQFGGYAGLLAVRLFDHSGAPNEFIWGEHRIPANTWQKIARASSARTAASPAGKANRKQRPSRANKAGAPAVIA
ncbi:MAG: hypothetical protein M3032_11570 [Verrucomicrobiota bacterium]|nr:hypothetical protein [Verrucomicrobiota bacterium]